MKLDFTSLPQEELKMSHLSFLHSLATIVQAVEQAQQIRGFCPGIGHLSASQYDDGVVRILS